MSGETKTARERFIDAVKNAGGSKAVAKRLGVSRSYADMLKSGDRDPGMLTAYRIEQEFKIPMQAWLVNNPRLAERSPSADH